MKKIIFNRFSLLLYSCFIAIGLQLTSCKKDEMAAPVITQIRNYEASPNDTIIDYVVAGQWVVLEGHNLSGIDAAFFNGVSANVMPGLFADNYAVINIPSIEFQNVPDEYRNKIEVVSEGGIGTFQISVKGDPYISYIRNFADAPNDTVTNLIVPGQEINIVGYNLENADTIQFQGIDIDVSTVVYTDSSVIVQVPADFSDFDTDLGNTITYSTNIGKSDFHLRILGPPRIAAVSCEYPQEGDVVYLYGFNLTRISELTFAGSEVTEYTESADGSVLEIIVPALTGSGPVSITTAAGTGSTIYNVNDLVTGMICNFDDIGTLEWGNSAGVIEENPDEFPYSRGRYGVFKNDIIAAWDWQAWSSYRIVFIVNSVWIPTEHLNDDIKDWAVKFEINVPKPWNGTTIFVGPEVDNFRYLYQPWKISDDNFVSYTTGGNWITKTIPLTSFTNGGWNGDGDPATSFSQLFGNDEGKAKLMIQTMNTTDGPSATGLFAGIDNIRVIKIK